MIRVPLHIPVSPLSPAYICPQNPMNIASISTSQVFFLELTSRPGEFRVSGYHTELSYLCLF